MLCAVSFAIGPAGPARADDTDCPKIADSKSKTSYICISITDNPGRVVQVSKDDLFAGTACTMCDVVDRTYRTVSPEGQSDSVEGVYGLSIDKLITTFAGSDVRAATTFTQANLTGDSRQALLDGTMGEIGGATGAPDPYQAGEPPPAIFFGNGVVPQASYIRPLRKAGDDRNASDYLTNGAANFIHILVHTSGKVLYPAISIINRVPGGTGTTISFEADPKSTILRYTWIYGDSAQDGPTDKTTTEHLYTKAGTYNSVVVVTADDTSYGQSPSISVTIGDITPDPTAPTTPGGNNPTGKQTEGPVDGSGTKAGGALSPVPGNGAGGGSGNASGTAQPTPGAGNGSAAGTAGTAAANGTASTSARASAGSGRGDLVQGLALYAPAQAAGAARSQAGQAQAAALRAGARDDASTDLLWLLWLIPIGLVGVGVFTERRRPRRQGSRL